MRYALEFPLNIIKLSRSVLHVICAVPVRCKQEALLESIAISQEAAKINLLQISCSVLWLCKHWTLRHAVSLCQEAAKLVFRGFPALDPLNCIHVQVPKYFGEFEFILTHFLNKLCFGAVLVAIGLFTPV
jgi:hypothetical protein